ncbi:MAG TPA: hypothetical protein EYP68_08625 [Candidatus Korarchaeota archaeon]|nr:hypothetical protein [Candidatus Korarchaeota archaeon]
MKEVPAKNVLKMLSETKSNARVTIMGAACSIDVIMLNGKPIAAYGISKGKKTSGKEALEVVDMVEDATAVAFKIDLSKISLELKAEERFEELPLRDLNLENLEKPALLIIKQEADSLILVLRDSGQYRVLSIGEKYRIEDFDVDNSLVWAYFLKDPDILIFEEEEIPLIKEEVLKEKEIEEKRKEKEELKIPEEEPIDYHSFVEGA